jgi:hypothetical protein
MIGVYRSAHGEPVPPVGGHSATHWVCDDKDYLLVFGGNADLTSSANANDKDKNVLVNSLFLFEPG